MVTRSFFLIHTQGIVYIQVIKLPREATLTILKRSLLGHPNSRQLSSLTSLESPIPTSYSRQTPHCSLRCKTKEPAPHSSCARDQYRLDSKKPAETRTKPPFPHRPQLTDSLRGIKQRFYLTIQQRFEVKHLTLKAALHKLQVN